MNKYLDALWELKLRVDAYDEYDENANKAFNILKNFILQTEEAPAINNAQGSDYNEMVEAIEFMKKHVEVQEHPDMFFHREMPERVLIDLRYIVNTPSFTTTSTDEEIKEANDNYNLCKRVLGLSEYKGE